MTALGPPIPAELAPPNPSGALLQRELSPGELRLGPLASFLDLATQDATSLSAISFRGYPGVPDSLQRGSRLENPLGIKGPLTWLLPQRPHPPNPTLILRVQPFVAGPPN